MTSRCVSRSGHVRVAPLAAEVRDTTIVGSLYTAASSKQRSSDYQPRIRRQQRQGAKRESQTEKHRSQPVQGY